MELLFNEQDVVDSVCVYTANREYANPQDVDVDLQFNKNNGFAASVVTNGKKERYLNEQEIIDDVAEYLQEYHNFIAERIMVDLRFSDMDGIHASIRISNV